ncbi:MAG: uroporphyrinogen-III synthase [Alkalilacustris sp.]
MAETPVLLLTRPRAQSERFAAGLAGCLATLPRVISPLIEIVPQTLAVDPEPYATLIFTSENGVASFAAQSGLRDRPAWCVGPRTAEAAAKAGFAVRSAEAEGGTAEALIGALRVARPATPLLHLRGAHAVTDLAGRLTAEGLACGETVVYAQQECRPSAEALAALAGTRPVLLPLFSPRSAALAAGAVRAARGSATGAGAVGRLHPVAISAAAAERWRRSWPGESRVVVACSPDAKGMTEALEGVCRALSERLSP